MRALSLLSAPCACAIVVLAYWWGGGAVTALVHGPSALIVLGGTAAATLVSHSLKDIVRALRAALSVFGRDEQSSSRLAAQLVEWSARAHRSGVLVLDAELEHVREPYLHHALALAVDGVEVGLLRDALAAESRAREAEDDLHVRVLETAAGYAPTFGMLGAVLGLMHVMTVLAEPGRLGGAMATAFVATVYGLSIANVLLLPLAGRLRERAVAGVRRRELIREAVIGLRQRTHPRLLATTIRGIAPTSATWVEGGTLSVPAPFVGGRPS